MEHIVEPVLVGTSIKQATCIKQTPVLTKQILIVP